MFALKRILDSPFGAVLQAIRENGERAQACGYNVNRIRWLSFVFSAAFAGLAGGLDAMRLSVVPIESLYWTTSGQAVIMTLLGGAGTFFGPFVGAGTYLVREDRLSVVTESWPLVVGAMSGLRLFLAAGSGRCWRASPHGAAGGAEHAWASSPSYWRVCTGAGGAHPVAITALNSCWLLVGAFERRRLRTAAVLVTVVLAFSLIAVSLEFTRQL